MTTIRQHGLYFSWTLGERRVVVRDKAGTLRDVLDVGEPGHEATLDEVHDAVDGYTTTRSLCARIGPGQSGSN